MNYLEKLIEKIKQYWKDNAFIKYIKYTKWVK
jgi:hypothetical protein